MGKRVVVVGGGVGGTIVANHLARKLGRELELGDLEITMISPDAQHFYQPGLLYVMFDLTRPEELSRSQASLLEPGIRLVQDWADHIDKDKGEVRTRAGQTFPYDFLLLATGSRPSPQLIPGLAEGGHLFYTLDGALKLREALFNFQGGKVVVTVGVPHKCPVAPLEVTFMLDAWFRQRGLRDKVELTYTYPIGRLHALEPVANWAVPQFAARDIHGETFFNLKEVDAKARQLTSIEGTTLPYDLLISVPPHQGAQVIIDSGVGDKGGWVPTGKHTLLMEGTDNVFVVGDTTNLPISKAGSTAHFEADVIADNLASRLQGYPGGRSYDGKVFCFVETGLEQATYVWFNFETPPNPVPPSQAIHWFKLAYNKAYWLTPKGVL
ncbi:MAG: FAD/NAD(P)-binding oxidoreductase [Thermaerobacter sp.]|jgi:sulfide:quinone oxidoreductase|nr:FAD/NAD(P)-binding oxidoreductase [Thermaerobacter sp.]